MDQKIFLILIYTSSITLYPIDLTQYTNKREMGIVTAANGKYSRKMATDITRRYLFAHYPEIPKDRRTEIVHKTLFYGSYDHREFISSSELLPRIEYGLKKQIFCDAIKHNDIDTIDTFLKGGLYIKDALILAIKEDNSDVIDKLLKKTPRYVFEDSYLDSILITALKYGSIDTVNKLLVIPNIGIKDNNTSALICAVNIGLEDIVDRLLQFPGIDVNSKDKFSHDTALIVAANRGNINIINKLLMVPGIDVNAVNKENYTALELAKRWTTLFGGSDEYRQVVDRLLQVPGIKQWKLIGYFEIV